MFDYEHCALNIVYELICLVVTAFTFQVLNLFAGLMFLIELLYKPWLTWLV